MGSSTGITPTYPPLLAYEVAFNAAPNQAALPPWWSDLSARTKTGPQSIARGRQYELDTNAAGVWRTTLENKDGALDPTNAASPFAPGVVPYRACRIRARTGANALTGDQATAGEATGYLGAIPVGMGVSNDFGYTPTIVASGSAYQGARVYQVTLPSAATQFTTVLLVTGVPVIPGVTYSFSAQVRINSGTTTATNASILWYNQAGTALTPVSGTAVTPTSGSATWLQAAVTGAAPPTAYSATLKIQIASGSTAASTTWQLDGLQWERSATPTPFQVPQTLPPNLLPRYVATGTAGINTLTDAAGNYFACAAGSISQATGLTAAPTGSGTAVAWSSPSGTTSASPFYAGAVASGAPALAGPVADCVQVAASSTYTASFYALRAASADATLAITPGITWYSATGAALSTSAGSPVTLSTGAWVRPTVTATAPAGAVWGRPQFTITTPSVTTATNTVYSTGWQMEAAASASTWLDPGPTGYLYSGLVERWPQTWLYNGTYPVANPTSVDALAALAQYTLLPPFVQEVLTLGPDFFYQLADPAGSTSVTDSAGKRPAAPIENSPFGAGSLTLGSSVTATTPSAAFLGSPGPVATFNNNPSQANTQEPQTFISLHKTTSNPGPPSTGGTPQSGISNPAWTRMFAFRASTVPASGNFPTLWATQAASYVNDNSFCQLNLNPTTGTLSFTLQAASGLGPAWTSGSNLCDGNWHQVAICYTGGLTEYFDVYLDGTRVFHDNNGGSGWTSMTNIDTDVIGANVVYGRNAYVLGWVGDAACAIQFPFALSTTQASNLYASWRTASSGESSGARAQRVLSWIGWAGTSAIDTGQTTNMGPASDLTGATALDALNAIALTENGNFYAAAGGTPTFTARTRRYQQLNPAVIFGENASLGEWPYQDMTADYDPQHLFNIVQVTQSSTGQVAFAQDAASQAAYFPRILQRTINPGLATEAQDAARYLLGVYKSARLRVANLTLNPSAIPGLFALCLNLEIGTRVRVMRRTASAPAIQFDGFIESVMWTLDPDSGQALVQLQCSPADPATYWLLAATRTTLHAQASSGQNQASINALSDSAVNALAQSLPAGYQLVFDPGTAIQETMTLAAGGIPATNPGYTTATLTFTSNFTNTHAAGATVCEPLPAGYSDPATWDAVSSIGAAYATVSGAQSSGTSQLTITALGDAQNNALASNWQSGDVIWIGPGTANFEGLNLLHPNVSTAGEGVIPLAAGTSGAALGLASDLGTPAVTASASAWQGANVWQVSVAGGVSTPSGLLYVLKTAATANLPFTGSAYVRSATTGGNPTVYVYIKFLDASANFLGQVQSSNTGLTGGPSAAWTRITASGTAPAGTVWVQLGIVLATAPGSAWLFQGDGLQIEQNASASTYQTAPQVKSAGKSVVGYSSTTITLAQNLVNSHGNGEWVCDPLPPGTVNPALVPGAARLAY